MDSPERSGCALTILIVVVLLASVPSWAQTTGSFVGVVTDPSSASVAGVQITLINGQTGLRRVVQSNDVGEYVVPLLPPGIYDIEAQAPGFERYIRTNQTLLVNQTLRVDLHMVVGNIQQKVEVTEQPADVDTATPTISNVITHSDVVNLPLNGRNFLQLATLVPGAVPGVQLTQNFTATTAGSNSLSVPQVNGLRSQSNNILLDGVDDNELFLGEAAAVPSPDSIQEFSIQTNLYDVEFGRGAGSIVNVVTKSGTGSFHGSLYDYLRNNALDARNFFSTGKPKLIRNQYGGSIGGPILKQRTQFFGSFEGTRLREGITKSASVPSVLEKSGNFSQSAAKPIDPRTGLPFTGDQIPQSRFDPVAKNLLQFYPDPNAGINLFNSSPTSQTDEKRFVARIDHKLGQKDNLFGSYLYQDGNSLIPFVSTFLGSVDVPTFPTTDTWRYQHLTASETHVFSSNIVNEFRFGLNRNTLLGLGQATQRNPRDFGFTFPTTIPGVFPQWAVAGFTVNGQSDMGPGKKTTDVFQWLDILNYTRGSHSLRAGIDIRRQSMDSKIPPGFGGAFFFAGAVTGNAFADFLLGRPLFFLDVGGNSVLNLYSPSYNFFVQDRVSLSRKLTLTVGLRYELTPWLVDGNNLISAFRPGQQSVVQPQAPVGLVYPGDSGVNRSTVTNHPRNFAPRIGLAWDPTGNGKTSVRAGYGIFYDPIEWLNFFQLQIAAPFGLVTVTGLPTAGLADPWAGASPFQPGVLRFPFSRIPSGFQANVLSPDLKVPYAEQYNLTVQHELLRGWSLQAAYVGTTGVHLPNAVDINQAVFVPGNSNFSNIEARRPFGPRLGSIYAESTMFSSHYDSFQLSVNTRQSHGVSFLAAYTFSKNIDTVSTPQIFRSNSGQQGTVMDGRNLKLDRGLSAFDATHRFVFSYLWQLPRFHGGNRFLRKLLSGWGNNGIVTLQTGLPFTVYDPTDPNVDGVNATNYRPDLVGDPNSGGRTLERWFNTAAFQRLVAPADHYGTAGRNILRGPGINNWDFAMVKTTDVTETTNIEFRAEFFNLWNHPGFAAPISDITSPNFGRVLDTRPGNERQIQMVLRLNF